MQQLDPKPTDDAVPPEAAPPVAEATAVPAVTLFVCSSCKAADAEPGTPPAGQSLLAATQTEAAGDDTFAVHEVKCLANCKRGLSAALVRTGGWSYVFGDLDAASAPDLVAGARLFTGSTDGLLPWRGRPDALKRGMVARIPPLPSP
ncbi:hypothetical protein GCM10007301_02070 [Azorhizobium oxalatiphilum]|uniref:Metal-binding protein n=1 Tax=Azorhizobium oxalatiphilum TaxID=980631 RepID=A0A917BJR1_9HYPH|nr:DUF1636 domain-containing protein [Azorhizobium oxalatiphilum]GGF46165.1 hypothetical protein GCM10007301_02070 [Azorhizobium oxalatiphilum]